MEVTSTQYSGDC